MQSKSKRKKIFVFVTRKGIQRIVATVILVGALIMLLTFELDSTRTWSKWTLPLSGKVIAIDPGHGGPDGGAKSKDGITEEQINLSIAFHLRDYLQQAGAIVVMTRETDTDLASPDTKGLSRRKTEDLVNRAMLIENHHVDILISIHLNSIPDRRLYGAQTFYYPENEGGKKLATFIQEEIKSNLENTKRTAHTLTSLYLLKVTKAPSALVEAGFLSNENEAKLLVDPLYQKKIATAIYRGVLRYSTETL